MPAWITVYTPTAPDQTVQNKVWQYLSACDWWTIAEDFDIFEQDVIDAASNQLAIAPNPKGFEIRYQSPEKRQLLAHIWTTPERVEEELEEVAAPRHLQPQLRQTKAVIAIELGWSQLDDMGIVIAFQAARALAEICNGIIKDENDEWMHIKNGFITAA